MDDEDRKCVVSLGGLVVGRQLGAGLYKRVYELCRDAGCKEVEDDVLQVVGPAEPRTLAEARKEVSFLKAVHAKMQELKLRDLVLPVRSYHECPARKKTFIIQQRADGTMEELGQLQAQAALPRSLLAARSRPVMVFGVGQLVEVFSLAQELYDRFKLIHGDLHTGNVFVRGQQFYLGDFGMTGAFRGSYRNLGRARIGFSAQFGCPTQPQVAPKLRRYYNVWQLELELRAHDITLVEFPSAIVGMRKMRFFKNVEQLGVPGLTIPEDVRKELDGLCPLLPARLEQIQEETRFVRRLMADQIHQSFDPEADSAISIDDAVEQLWSSRQNISKTLTPAARRVVRLGMNDALYRSNIVLIPSDVKSFRKSVPFAKPEVKIDPLAKTVITSSSSSSSSMEDVPIAYTAYTPPLFAGRTTPHRFKFKLTKWNNIFR